jgi:DNA repair exonuclease SbcCD ATPase subunit
MNRTIGILTWILVSFSSSGWAQSPLVVVEPSELKVKRQAMELAFENWQATDKGLEKYVFSRPTGEMSRKLARAIQTAKEYHQARNEFFLGLAGNIRKQVESMETSTEATISPEWTKAIESRLDDLARQQAQMEARLAARGADSEDPTRLAVDLQRKKAIEAISSAKENLHRQTAEIQRMTDQSERLAETRHDLVSSLKQTADLVENHANLASLEGSLLLRYYEALESLLGERGKGQANAPSKKE